MSAAVGAGRAKAAIRLVPRRPLTKEILITTGEFLFGRHGIDGISLREIAAAAGQANSHVVQYHFQDKAGFVSAILEDRVTRVEALRAQCLQRLTASMQTPREFLKIQWLPTMAIKDGDGNHTFCRFLLQYMLQPNIALHPIAKLYAGADWQQTNAGKDISGLAKAMRLLRAHYNHLPRALFIRRLSALSMTFLASVVQHDNARLLGKKGVPSEFDLDSIIDMALGALSVPR
jgi:AcrR family transcriptional regulator